jgi:ribosome-associated protein
MRVNRSVEIPDDELKLTFSPSGGPGGQHANRSSTRVELVWNIRDTTALGPRQKERVFGVLRRRIDSAGNLRITSDRYRSQHRNRTDALEKLSGLVRDALVPPRPRVGTKPTRGSQEQRLRAKKQRGEIKRQRKVRRKDLDDDR